MINFIVNLHGGSGNAIVTWQTVTAILEEKKVEYKAFITENHNSATEFAKQITSSDEEEIKLVVVGGDGTVNQVINGIVNFDKVKFGVIPTGSGNDFARGVGIPYDTEAALEKILDSKEIRKIDLGLVKTEKCERRLFGISAGLGLDAIVCKKALSSKLKDFLNKLHMGEMIYSLYTVQTLFSMRTENFMISFDGGEFENFNKLIFIAFMNTFAEGGGVPMAPDARYDDGEISICLANGVPRIQTLFYFLKLKKGLHKGLKGMMLRNCKTLDIKIVNPVTLHLDGEYGNEVQEVHVEMLQQVLGLMQ